jgi:hypothetical protein
VTSEAEKVRRTRGLLELLLQTEDSLSSRVSAKARETEYRPLGVIGHLDRQDTVDDADTGGARFRDVFNIGTLSHGVCATASNDERLNTTILLAMIGSGIASRDTEDQVPTTVLRSCMYKKMSSLLSWMGSQIHGGPGTELADHENSLCF